MEVNLASIVLGWFLNVDLTCIVCNWDSATNSYVPAAGSVGAAAAAAGGLSGAGPWPSNPYPGDTPPLGEPVNPDNRQRVPPGWMAGGAAAVGVARPTACSGALRDPAGRQHRRHRGAVRRARAAHAAADGVTGSNRYRDASIDGRQHADPDDHPHAAGADDRADADAQAWAAIHAAQPLGEVRS